MGIWLLRRLRRPFALAPLFLLTLPVTAQGAPPVLIRQDRGVFAQPSGAAGLLAGIGLLGASRRCGR